MREETEERKGGGGGREEANIHESVVAIIISHC